MFAFSPPHSPPVSITQHEFFEFLVKLGVSKIHFLNIVEVGLEVDQMEATCEKNTFINKTFVLEVVLE